MVISFYCGFIYSGEGEHSEDLPDDHEFIIDWLDNTLPNVGDTINFNHLIEDLNYTMSTEQRDKYYDTQWTMSYRYWSFDSNQGMMVPSFQCDFAGK